MSTNTMARWRLLPWIAFVAALTATAALAGLRERATDAEHARAVESASSHFQEIVDETKDRAKAASDNYERVLAGAIVDLGSPLAPDEVAARLDVLRADQLPGAVAFFATPAGGQTVLVAEPSETPVAASDLIRVGPGVSATLLSDEMVQVSYTAATGDAVTVVANVDGLVESYYRDDAHAVHGDMVSLVPPATSSEVDHALSVHDAAMPEASTPDLPAHEHDLSGAGTFLLSANETVPMFGQDWTVAVVADESFLIITESRESLIVGVFGVLLSLALFALIVVLVRRLEAESRRRQAEERARSATERFAAGFTTSPTGSAVIDLEGRVIEANQALVTLMGQGRLIGRPLSQLVSEPHRPEWVE